MLQLNLSSIVCLKGFHSDSRYERFRRLQVLRNETERVDFQGIDFAAGGAQRTLRSGRYTLLVDGVERAVVDVAAGTREASFQLNTSGIPDGWRRFEIGNLGAGETSPPWYMFVSRGAGPIPEQPFTPVVRGTYELVQRADGWHAWALAPGRYEPKAVPLPRREYPAFSNQMRRAEWNCMQLVPVRFGDTHRPSRNRDGIITSYDLQAYFWHDMVAKTPRLPGLDGPRGVGTISMVTHVSVGTAAPEGRPRNTLYVCDPWRVAKITEDGTITTLVGYRHNQVASYYEDPAVLELVGDWSAVPPERRGFHELWGMAWDERTLAINESAAPIPAEGNERPHVTGPVMFLSDTQNNRIVKCEFSATRHGVPPKVTEFITGSQDAWDVVYANGLLYVSERLSHRIVAYDATTGAFVRVVVEGPALATVDSNRTVRRRASLDVIRAQPCVAPEGLYKLPGDPWLYFGSVAMAQVKRVHLGTGQVEVFANVATDDNSMYFKIAVSDGTFGPRGTVFVWQWSPRFLGYAPGYLPDTAGVGPASSQRHWNWFEEPTGPGQWEGFVYATAGAVAGGRMVSAGANEGLLVISRSQPGDRTQTEAVRRGAREFSTRGLHLLHGSHGFGYYGLPLPWGVSSNLDAYLRFHGHTQ